MDLIENPLSNTDKEKLCALRIQIIRKRDSMKRVSIDLIEEPDIRKWCDRIRATLDLDRFSATAISFIMATDKLRRAALGFDD